MEITLEQAERLKEKANVSYARAKEALEHSGGNLLDALIYLEEQGDIPRPEGTQYSTREETEEAAADWQAVPPREGAEGAGKKPGPLTHLRWFLLDNELEIWRKGQPITSLPVLILILLVTMVYYITIPLLILGLFLGFRYRFSGPDLDRDDLNGAMGAAADTAAQLGRRVAGEFRHAGGSEPEDE